MDILALSSKYSFGGVLSLGGILCLIIAVLLYRKGPVFGAGVCATLCIISAVCSSDPSGAMPDSIFNFVANNDSGYITNISKTKWIKKGGLGLDDRGAIFICPRDLDRPSRFIPTEETDIVDGMIVMKHSGKSAHSYDLLTDEEWEARQSPPRPWGNINNVLHKVDGKIVKMDTGEPPTDDDYYLYDVTYPSPAVKSHLGEAGGMPQWVWHPAAPIWIFGIFGLPGLIGGAIINKKLS